MDLVDEMSKRMSKPIPDEADPDQIPARGMSRPAYHTHPAAIELNAWYGREDVAHLCYHKANESATEVEVRLC
jgi:hypothetical protein